MEDDEIEDSMEQPPEISQHALSCWTTYKKMWVMVRIGPYEVVVLIDIGSTHNFISNKMATMLQLPVLPTEPFNVKVANGEPLKCQGIFENVPIMLQGIPFILTLYALPLIGLDLVLGVHWLAQLGTVTCNWKKLTMEFQWDNKNKKLQGIDTFNPTCNYESHHQGSMARRVHVRCFSSTCSRLHTIKCQTKNETIATKI